MDFTKTNLLISSREPEKLGRFYSFVMDLNLSEGFSVKDFNIRNIKFENISFFKPSNRTLEVRFSPPSLALCFESRAVLNPINLLETFIKEITSIGGRLIEGPVIEEFGAEAWLADIEDNYFLVFVPLLKQDRK